MCRIFICDQSNIVFQVVITHVLTELSSPSVSSIKKNMIAQKVDPGKVAMAMG